jgi:hypothetical protein
MAFQAKEYEKTTGQKEMRDYYESASKETLDAVLRKSLASVIRN